MNGKEKSRGTWSGALGFVMAAAGSAIGLGNIWRFPYLAARGGGGVFILCYIILAATFGFTLLVSEVAIGRRTTQSPISAYSALVQAIKGKSSPLWLVVGVLACIVPVIILPYYTVIGGWVVKYFVVFLRGAGEASCEDGFFGAFISDKVAPIVFFAFFLFITAFVVFKGVDKGIERWSKILMPILFLLIIAIAVFALFLRHSDSSGATRTGLEGFKIYLLPDFTKMSLSRFFSIVTDAMGQLFYSISVAMGIMITYGSYVPRSANLNKCVNRIEIFDTLVALLAGAMIIPAVYVFMGREGLSSSGPSLIFVALPKVFSAMGAAGRAVGLAFFLMVIFAAITSNVSIMEAIVSCLMDKFRFKRVLAVGVVTSYALLLGVVVCFGYNIFYFDVVLPNGSHAQILDIMDYVSNSVLMPVVAIATCVLIGWVLNPKVVIEEVTIGGVRFRRRALYKVMVKFIAPVLLLVLLLKSFNLFG